MTFYIVSTPIGNLKDITLNALEVLFDVDLIVCEDTRQTQKLLSNYANGKSIPEMISYNDHNRDQRIPLIMAKFQEGQNIALVTDRGTPLVSDPGYRLMREIIKLTEIDEKYKIEILPGASALLPALQLSGFPPDKFLFLGFLPRKKSHLTKLIEKYPEITLIAYESPHRIMKSLTLINDFNPELQIAVCFELTKMNQRVYRGTVTEVIENMATKSLKGEVVVVMRWEGE